MKYDIFLFSLIFLIILCILFVPIIFSSSIDHYIVTSDLSPEEIVCKNYKLDRDNFCIYLSNVESSFLTSFDNGDVIVVRYSKFYKIKEVRDPSLFERWFCE